MAISHGSEMRVYRGELPHSCEGETIAALGQSSGYPVKYGYMNVGVAEDGRRYFAFYPHQDYFECARSDLLEIPSDVRDEDAVLLPSVETALNIVHDASPRFGESVLVAGQGVIGLLLAELLTRTGANVLTLEPRARRREYSTAVGCRAMDPEDPNINCEIREATEGRGADVCINTTGNDAALQALIDNAGEEARVVEASWYGSAEATLSLGVAFHRRRLRLESSQVSRISSTMTARWSKQRRFDLVMRLLSELEPRKYVTHRFPLSEAAAAYRLLDSGEEGTLQILLEP
jgi:threonine dehydrogenase-like Zn-dependent dehydrogenase